MFGTRSKTKNYLNLADKDEVLPYGHKALITPNLGTWNFTSGMAEWSGDL